MCAVCLIIMLGHVFYVCDYVGQFSCQTNGNLGLGKQVVTKIDDERELSGDDIQTANLRKCAILDV